MISAAPSMDKLKILSPMVNESAGAPALTQLPLVLALLRVSAMLPTAAMPV